MALAVRDSTFPARRLTSTEQPRVTRRDLAGVPSQQVEILRSKAVNQEGLCSEIKLASGRDAQNFALMRSPYPPVVCIAAQGRHDASRRDIPRMTRS